MDSPVSGTAAARGAALLAVIAFLGVLAWFLPRPGYSSSRLLLFGLLAGAAVLGGAGVWVRRSDATLAGAVGLALLGFWQAVLGVFVLPVVGLLVLAGLLERERAPGAPEG